MDINNLIDQVSKSLRIKSKSGSVTVSTCELIGMDEKKWETAVFLEQSPTREDIVDEYTRISYSVEEAVATHSEVCQLLSVVPLPQKNALTSTSSSRLDSST